MAVEDRQTRPDQTRHDLQRLKKAAGLLDTWIRVPGTRLSFGLDGLLGLIPVLGDTVTLLAGLWIVAEAHRIGVSKPTLARMLANVGIDYAIGAVPVLGDLFDFFWKANRRNVRLLEREVERREHQA
ncbi:DUF4112 domain-containing protein [Thalassospiraceae bacterium LMO-JJ14]|nr:DUF4112 domain-containing protein [Thalassospiraceae bacterium LMO-JJ14]